MTPLPTMLPAILYIDDEAMLCRVFHRVLDGCGAPIVTFTDPELALAYTREQPGRGDRVRLPDAGPQWARAARAASRSTSRSC